jgi:integrase
MASGGRLQWLLPSTHEFLARHPQGGTMAEGIRRRHSSRCESRKGGRCDCDWGWEASVFSKREGKKIRKVFARQAEAKTWRAEALRALSRGGLQRSTSLTLEQAAWLWLQGADGGVIRDRSGQRYKPGTLREYRRALALRVLPQFGHVPLSELTRADLQQFADGLQAHYAASTIRNTLNPLQAIYRYAVRRDVVQINPTREVELPAADGRRERIATAEEAERLIAALPESDQALWACAFYAGLRRGELRALRTSDIDMGRSEIQVAFNWDDVEGPIPPKSKAGQRTIPVFGVLRDMLDARALGTDSDLAFGRAKSVPFSPKSVSDRAKRAWKAANEREEEVASQEKRDPNLLEPITLHECRHTFASLLIDAGVNAKAIQEFMGHASVDETFSRYGHLMPGAREQARELVDDYMSKRRAEGAQSAPAEDGLDAPVSAD